MVLRVVQTLDIKSRDEFHRTCPPSVKSLMEYPIPALFANSQKNSLQEDFMNTKNRKFYYDRSDDEVSDEGSDEVEDEPDDHTDGSRNVEDTVLSFFGDKLQKVRGMDISTDNADIKDDRQKGSARKLTDVTAQLEEAIREAHLRNNVDDTFQNKVAQAKLLLRLQTAYENGSISANLLVGQYTAIMKEKLQTIVDLAEQVQEENTDDDTDWSEDSGDSIESLAISLPS